MVERARAGLENPLGEEGEAEKFNKAQNGCEQNHAGNLGEFIAIAFGKDDERNGSRDAALQEKELAHFRAFIAYANNE